MSVQFELITVAHDSGQLHGLLHRRPAHRGLVLHVHGTWGNFYGNPFIPWFAETYDSAGLAFASVNFPGHDETSIDEQAPASLDAFSPWLETLRVDQEPVLLQGHSLGAIKIAHLARTRGLPSGTAGVVLLAPFDAVAFNSRSTGGNLPSLHAKLQALIDDGAALVPSEIFEYWPISPQTLMDLTTVGGAWDQFPTRNGEAGDALRNVQVPALVAVGAEDFAATPDPQGVVDILSAGSNVVGVVIPGAPHNFAGQEQALMRAVSEWVSKTMPA